MWQYYPSSWACAEACQPGIWMHVLSATVVQKHTDHAVLREGPTVAEMFGLVDGKRACCCGLDRVLRQPRSTNDVLDEFDILRCSDS